MKYVLLSLCVLLLNVPVLPAEEKELPAEEFFKQIRSLPLEKSWGILEGTVHHRRKGASPVKEKIRFSVLFAPAVTTAQIVFREKEVYNVSQNILPPFESSLESPVRPTLTDVGLRPEDLTMSFLCLPLEKELPKTSVRGQTCRVFDFKSSPSRPERVRVFIAARYGFPLRVEWFALTGGKTAEKPFRTLEVDSFGKTGELWVVRSLSVFGPGWMTGVSFPDARAGLVKTGVPKDLFR